MARKLHDPKLLIENSFSSSLVVFIPMKNFIAILNNYEMAGNFA
jgi:hypothetical protein